MRLLLLLLGCATTPAGANLGACSTRPTTSSGEKTANCGPSSFCHWAAGSAGGGFKP